MTFSGIKGKQAFKDLLIDHQMASTQQFATNLLSPSKSKLQQLGERMRNFSFEDYSRHGHINTQLLRDEKAADILLSRFNALSDRVQKSDCQMEAKLSLIEDEIQKTQEILENEETTDRNHVTNLLQELQSLEKRLQTELGEMSRQRKADEGEEIRRLEEHIETIKSEFANNQEERNNNLSDMLENVGNELEDARTRIESEKVLRDEVSEELIKDFGEQILKLQEMLTSERKEREANVKGLTSALEQLEEELAEVLVEEKQARLITQSTFTKMLDETCRKLEQGFTY